MHSNVMHRFMVKAFQYPPFCSSTTNRSGWNLRRCSLVFCLMYNCRQLSTRWTLSPVVCRMYNCRQLSTWCTTVGCCLPDVQLSAVVCLMYNCRQLSTLYKTVGSCLPCIKLSAVVCLMYNCRQLSTLCKTVGSCLPYCTTVGSLPFLQLSAVVYRVL
jgi:hypothetical protein